MVARGDLQQVADLVRGVAARPASVHDGPVPARGRLERRRGLLARPCLDRAIARGWSWSTSRAAVFDKPYTAPSAGEVLVLTGDLGPGPEQAPEEGVTSFGAYQMAGTAGPDVRGIDIVLTNGMRVTATVQDGIWGAWWPATEGDPSGSRLHVHTAAGTQVVDPAAVGVF